MNVIWFVLDTTLRSDHLHCWGWDSRERPSTIIFPRGRQIGPDLCGPGYPRFSSAMDIYPSRCCFASV